MPGCSVCSTSTITVSSLEFTPTVTTKKSNHVHPTRVRNQCTRRFNSSGGEYPPKMVTKCFFVGIIDILTNYDLRKVGEHLSKSLVHEAGAMSCVPPADYQSRFVKYLESIIEGR
eukprot:PhF_6_TR26255/c0_g1_i1/m.37549